MTMPPPVIGLVGCGAIGALHAEQLQRRGVDLRFHNRSPAAAHEFARRFGGAAVESFDELLSQSAAVVIATPPEHHIAACLAALAVGCGVLVEKPLCLNLDELQQIEAAAAQSEGFVMVAENYYYKPSTVMLRETLAWGGIGAVKCLRIGKQTQQTAEGWKSNHGALFEGGIHYVALVADLIDAALAPQQAVAQIVRPEEVVAKFPTSDAGPKRQAILTLKHGEVEAQLHYAWDTPRLLKGTFQHCRIDGDEGRVVFECNGMYVDVRGPGRRGLSFPGFRDLMGYGAMIEEFLTCVGQVLACAGQTSPAPYSNLIRARRDLEIIWRAYEQLPTAPSLTGDAGA
mgnify:CR=1 FL=1